MILYNEAVETIASLREATQDLHRRIESRFDFSVHFASVASYRRLLARYYGFYLPFENHIYSLAQSGSWAALGIDFQERQKVSLLANDLEALGLTQSAIEALPLCPPALLPRPQSPAAVVGCAYVLEGATLGGTLIASHIEQVLGLPVGTPGARFFYGYGTQTGKRWSLFRRSVQALDVWENVHPSEESGNRGEQPIQQAIRCARQTFTALEECLFTDILVTIAPERETYSETI